MMLQQRNDISDLEMLADGMKHTIENTPMILQQRNDINDLEMLADAMKHTIENTPRTSKSLCCYLPYIIIVIVIIGIIVILNTDMVP
jgi:uncharacterized protein Yka (UPF0111/DUF47 family)